MPILPSEPSLAVGKGGVPLCRLILPQDKGLAGRGEAGFLNVSPSISIAQPCYDWGLGVPPRKLVFQGTCFHQTALIKRCMDPFSIFIPKGYMSLPLFSVLLPLINSPKSSHPEKLTKRLCQGALDKFTRLLGFPRLFPWAEEGETTSATWKQTCDPFYLPALLFQRPGPLPCFRWPWPSPPPLHMVCVKATRCSLS